MMKKRIFSLATALLLACGSPAFAKDAAYECGGNEPFWSLKISGNEATRMTPSDQENDPDGVTTHAQGLAQQGQDWMVWRGIFADWGDTVAFVTKGPCEDSMSGLPSPYHIRLSLPSGEVHQGCCERAK